MTFDDPIDQYPQVAADSGPSADEFAQAVNAILVRRMRHEIRQARASVVNGVSAELSLDVDTEEVVSELDRRYQLRRKRTERLMGWRRLRNAALTCAFVAFTMAILYNQYQATHNSPKRRLARHFSAFDAKLPRSQGANAPYELRLIDAQPEIKTEDTIYDIGFMPDGATFYGDPFLFVSHFNVWFQGMTVTFVRTPTNNGAGPLYSNLTAMTRYDGHYYLRGWIRPEDKTNVLAGRSFRFFPHRQLALWWPQPLVSGQPIKITLPMALERQYAVSAVGTENVTEYKVGTPIPVDEHTWEDYRE